MSEDLVSAIVPTRNSAQTVGACLESIKAQSYSASEIIVVDNSSTDKTWEIAQKFTEKVFKKGPERSAQRNLGAEKSEGKYLLFIDSDQVLSAHVVEDCVRKIKESEQIKAVIIPETTEGSGFWTKCKALERSCYVGDDDIEAARFFDREIFFQLGGYDEEIHGGGEDWDLPIRVKKAGLQIGRINSFINHLEGHIRFKELMRTKRYYGQTMSKYIRKHPEIARRQLRVIRPAFIRNWRKLAKDPVHAAGFIFMKIGEFTAGAFGALAKRDK